MEIYNENLKDLLVTGMGEDEEPLEIREDPVRGVYISGVEELECSSTKEVMNLLVLGNENRSTESTDANSTSSRSHAVLMISVEFQEKGSDSDSEGKIGKFALIDLAGSERASQTNNVGIRLIEGANINKSLLSLGNCINALYQN